MRLDKLVDRMLEEERAMLLLDRRNSVRAVAQKLGYEVVELRQAYSPIGNTPVHVALLRPCPGSRPRFPERDDGREASHAFVRLLDRFYLPAAGDPTVSALLFELIAARYDQITAANVNIDTAEILLQAALIASPAAKTRKVLDFGCGTGCSVDALRRLGSLGREVELLGTDLSKSMMAIARARGQNVVGLQDWREMPAHSFSAAISCFVLHYGVPTDDLARIANQLETGGTFSANVFKLSAEETLIIIMKLEEVGLVLKSNTQMSTTPHTTNRHLVFTRQ